MPGSLLNLLDIHSDQSDVFNKSVDSRTSGKKVSFNKAVRVKQYPWRPDEYRTGDGAHTLPSQRFWFKVYKTNPNTDHQNSWVDQNHLKDCYNEDILDSLTPIAEDDDTLSDIDFSSSKGIYSQLQSTFPGDTSPHRSFPEEPPIDYVSDEMIPDYENKYKSENGTKFEYDGGRGKIENKKVADSACKREFFTYSAAKGTSGNGVTVPSKYHDFKRPTISSAAKCVSEPKVKSGTNRQPINNTRLSRMAVKEYASERNKGDNTKHVERRSRSTDIDMNSERFDRQIKKADKSVSTDDLTLDYKENEENLSRNRLWWTKKGSKDKATQFSGTLTKMKKTNPFRTTLSSTSNNVKESSTRGIQTVNYGEKVTGKWKDNSKDHDVSYTKADSKPLLLCGKGFTTTSKMNHSSASLDATTNCPSRIHGKEQRNSSSEVVESNPVTNDLANANNDTFVCATKFLPRENENKHRPFPWRTVRDRKFIMDIEKANRDTSPERTKDIISSSTVGYIRGRQMPRRYGAETPIISIPKIKSSASESDRICYVSDQEIASSRNVSPFRNLSRERSSSSDRGFKFGHGDNSQSMIDWSLSGFRLGSRQDSKITSSSDSECVVHRRPPLLMYIPGVSHHDRPAVEDDRLSALSGISRSEAEDDVSPLTGVHNGGFKRRHSMPRNGKLNWLKRKANKKIIQQT